MLSRLLAALALLTVMHAAPPLQEQTPAEARLASVRNWFYFLEVPPADDVIEQVIDSEYDMVVMDAMVTERDSQDYDIEATVHALQDAGKLVIAYIDIGQAESYRAYWQADWRIGDPEWIVGEDPDGWEENYPVAFWYDEWQGIWFDPPNELLQVILGAGFDGVYMDWVEAYSDDNVLALAERDNVDPIEEMIYFVGDISGYVKERREDFIVIAQNAAELAEYDEYLEAIDALAQEQAWFDGVADGDEPEGDCPLPATDEDVDTEAYARSLPELCRRYLYGDPYCTLHVSTEEYLYYLTMARDAGEIVFTVDYALIPENVEFVYRTSRALGFIPFVSNRALNRYFPPALWEG
jgi:cysteinyl-tRNA synthetase